MSVKISLLAVIAVVLALAATATAAPPGATAQCRDRTYSFSQHRAGTCSHHGGVLVWLRAGTAASQATRSGRVVLLAPRTRTNDCRRGALPDRRCSPGAYDTALTRGVLCSRTFRTTSIRNVPQSEKFAVERAYGMPARLYGRSLEIDHIVSLELGGANVAANLFPEPAGGVAGYHVKDRLENRLHTMVCQGSIGLRAAQHGIATNWKALYRRVFGVSP